MKIYIAGQMTGKNDYQKDFRRAEKELIKKGEYVFNPCNLLPIMRGFDYSDFMQVDLKIIELCDAVYFLKGFTKSKGAMQEYQHAKKHHKVILTEEPFDDYIGFDNEWKFDR